MNRLSNIITFGFLLAVASYCQAVLVIDDDGGTVDPASATIDGAIFRLDGPNAGTGTINPTLAKIDIGGEGEEFGHNGLADNNNATFTNTLRIFEFPIVDFGGTDYFSMWVDINEAGAAAKLPLLIDDFSVFTDSSDSLSYDYATNGSVDPGNGDLGTLRYTMASDTLDVRDTTDGTNDNQGDMQILIPVANFIGASTDDYVYLWARMNDADGGDEAFAIITGITGETQTTLLPGGTVTAVPEPSPILFGGFLLAIAGGTKLFRRFRAAKNSV